MNPLLTAVVIWTMCVIEDVHCSCCSIEVACGIASPIAVNRSLEQRLDQRVHVGVPEMSVKARRTILVGKREIPYGRASEIVGSMHRAAFHPSAFRRECHPRKR